MTAPTGIMLRLREETAPHHEHAESRPLEQSLVRGVLPRELYCDMLEQRYLIHRELEAQARKLRESQPMLAKVLEDTLFQESNLHADLVALGRDPKTAQPKGATQRLIHEIQSLGRTGSMALLGVYYVFEGSKNGARFIAKRVGPAYGLSPGPGMLYLDPHGEAQRPIWMEFKQRMDACHFSQADQDAMVEAAKLTFDCIADLDDEMMRGQAVHS